MVDKDPNAAGYPPPGERSSPVGEPQPPNQNARPMHPLHDHIALPPPPLSPRPPGGYSYQEKLRSRRGSPANQQRNTEGPRPILIGTPGQSSGPGQLNRRSPPIAMAPSGGRNHRKAPTEPPSGFYNQPPPPPPPPRGPPPRVSSHNNPRPNRKNRHPQNGPRMQPILKDDEWRKWPEITVVLGPGVPIGVGLHGLLTEFHQYGNMEYMAFEDGQRRNDTVRLRMTDVKRPFWDRGEFTLEIGITVPIKLVKQKTNFFFIKSPVDHTKTYPDRFAFYAESLEFGFMIEPTTMMKMYEIDANKRVAFHVNFRQRFIQIRFRVIFKRPDSEEKWKEEDEDQNITLDRTEIFKFEIPLSHLSHLIRPPKEGENERSFIVPSQSPPKYWRQLADWSKSIDSQKNWWSVQDTWMRQTAIEYNMRKRRFRPIGLCHKTPIIDIGRWTTFRLTFKLKKYDLKKFDNMMQCLNDFNVETKVNDYKISDDKSSLRPVWAYIDKPVTNGDDDNPGKSWLHQLEQCDGPELLYTVRYQLEVCISNDYLNEFNVTKEFIDQLAGLDENVALRLLEHIADKQKRYFNPMDIFHIPRSDIRPGSTRTDLPDYCAIMRRATVTPSGILYSSPSVDPTNRVIRGHPDIADRFLRVTFTDEKLYGRINWSDKQTTNELFSRVFQTLNMGIVIGDRRYDFLAFGNSQLREHGAYFFAPLGDKTAADIRKWMGDFKDIDIVAKYASRLGQCFSTTRKLNSDSLDIQEIPDLEHDGYCFSDGVGKISSQLCEIISLQLGLPSEASCFQFRLGGNKGVLAVDPALEGHDEVKTRPSQRKFDSTHVHLEIIRTSQFATAHLNRQLITVLSTLGVPDEIFLGRMGTLMDEYKEAMVNPTKAMELLLRHIDANQCTLVICQLVKEGFMASKEPYVMSLLKLWRSWTIKYLKEKARLPIDDAAFVLGVVDETGKLKGYWKNDPPEVLPEIFLQLTDLKKIPLGLDGRRMPFIETNAKRKIVTGPCVIARNPSLHPGDVRVVNAVDIPELHHQVDVVVFPSTGDRPIPTMLSGGDLDGDDYIIIWDKEFWGHTKNAEPASYSPVDPARLGRDVQIADVTAFFVNYMKNDRLGTIANNHLAWSDQLPEGVKSDKCCELATLHSDAVDYPKTGVPAIMPAHLRCTKFPHFMEKDPDRSYKSVKILGQLYDEVERVDFIPCYDLPFNKDILNSFPDIEEGMLEKARKLKGEYDAQLRRILAQNGIRTEFEVVSTFVLRHSMGNDYKFHEEMGRISATQKDRYRKRAKDAAKIEADLPKFVAAMYKVTADEFHAALYAVTQVGDITPRQEVMMPLMSFPWIFPEILCRLAKGDRSSNNKLFSSLDELPELEIDPNTGVEIFPPPPSPPPPPPVEEVEDLLL